MKNKYPMKISRDGIVTFWSVYEQRWLNYYASLVLDRDLASMNTRERKRIAAAIPKEPEH
jgi:hypothetical protein